MNLLALIKQAALDATESTNPVSLSFGQVISTQPLEVMMNPKLTLTSEFLLLGSAVSGTLQEGDRVIVLRAQGGQIYVVLDKVVA